jgi:hypothetical protein
MKINIYGDQLNFTISQFQNNLFLQGNN